MPAEDQRCDDCENVWLEKAARRELGRWGIASTSLVSVAKWAGRAGGLGLALGILMAFFPTETILALWAPVALLLLGFPVAIGAVCALPFVRAAERGVDLAIGDDRKNFLLENKGDHAARLLAAPSTDE
jgi:hypothetical protein